MSEPSTTTSNWPGPPTSRIAGIPTSRSILAARLAARGR
jgi:hypothetical protein